MLNSITVFPRLPTSQEAYEEKLEKMKLTNFLVVGSVLLRRDKEEWEVIEGTHIGGTLGDIVIHVLDSEDTERFDMEKLELLINNPDTYEECFITKLIEAVESYEKELGNNE